MSEVVAFIRQLVDDSSRAGHFFNLFIQALIVLSMLSFAMDTLPHLTASVEHELNVMESVIVGIFTIEYVLRLIAAKRRLRFVFSISGLIDLAAILPFYFNTGLDLRSVRALRLLRMLKLLRYHQATNRLRHAIVAVKDELVVFISGTAIVLYLAAIGIYYCEHDAQPDRFASVFDGLWWAVVTLTTVGYGDIYPVTAGGKLFTGLILVIGLGIVAVPTGLIASALTRRKEVEQEEAQRDRETEKDKQN